jgi:hypothetical protein
MMDDQSLILALRPFIGEALAPGFGCVMQRCTMSGQERGRQGNDFAAGLCPVQAQALSKVPPATHDTHLLLSCFEIETKLANRKQKTLVVSMPISEKAGCCAKAGFQYRQKISGLMLISVANVVITHRASLKLMGQF